MSAQICITGIGVRSAVGNTAAVFAEYLRAGVSGIREQTGIFPGQTIWAGMVELEAGDDQPSTVDRAALLALQASRAAWQDAFPSESSKPEGSRVALILGTSHGGRSQIDHCIENPQSFETCEASFRILETSPHFRQTEFVARQLGIHGPVLTISTACSSSSAAILCGMDLLQSRKADYVLAGGMDGFSKLTHAGFRALGAVSEGPCGPFSERIGISLGEGAAVIVMERRADAVQRNIPIWAELYGGGSSWDCYHITEPEPSGEGLLRALEMAASRGRVASERDFCYANLHGTGTRANDAAETIAIKRFFAHKAIPPASSVKSFTGHTLGASGAMGVITSIIGMHHSFLPPTANYIGARAGCDLDYVPNHSRDSEITHFSAQSAGFGGVNVVVMGGRSRELISSNQQKSVRIAISGIGVVSAAGIGADAFRDALLARRSGIGPIDRFATSGPQDLQAGMVRNFEPRKIAPTLNLRRADLCFQYAAVAVAEALAQSRLVEREVDMSRVGLVAGTTRGAVNSFEQAMKSALGGAWEKTGPMHFPNLVMSSLGGVVSKMFNLRGSASTLVCGRGGGLQAIIHAFELLRCNPTQQAIVVVVADELSPLFYRLFFDSGKLAPSNGTVDSMVYDSASRGAVMGEGAAAFVLEKSQEDNPDSSRLYLSGYGLTSDSELNGSAQANGAWLSESIRQALREAHLAPADIDMIYGHGSGSPCHDKRELRALSQVLDRTVPLSCVLPNTGLAESASAGFSLAAAAMSLQHGEAYPMAVPTHPSSDWNFVYSQPDHFDIKNILLTGSSDAGNNAALILSKHKGAGPTWPVH